jgi:hypothetical protein
VQDAKLEYAKRLAEGDDSANEGKRAQTQETQEEATSVVTAKQSAEEVEKAGILEAARLAALKLRSRRNKHYEKRKKSKKKKQNRLVSQAYLLEESYGGCFRVNI